MRLTQYCTFKGWVHYTHYPPPPPPAPTVNSFLTYSNWSSCKNIILPEAMLPDHRVYLQSVYNVRAM